MTVALVEKARFGRLIALEALVARKSGHEPKTVSLEAARSASRFENVDHLMERYDQMENIFAA
ncbi:hypothetical protein [uncultured Tateyamaria sp.]|uniref:hypothetical protein n=1 Tax=uncultured Tateyamaria sp. TaxID=455651 RepID=UPI0026113128|nr:hypothetical protein [uncultured Tateyamaria sp.]